MSETTPGAVQHFEHRSGGYINYLYNTKKLPDFGEEIHPEYTLEEHMHTKEQVDQMMEDVNSLMEKYFPWMKDFIIFQLHDGTVRIDIANRAYLGDD